MSKTCVICIVFVMLLTPVCSAENESALEIRFYGCKGIASDYQGKRAGFDKKTNKDIGEFEKSSCGVDYPEADGLEESYEILIDNPIEGLYKVTAIGTVNGMYGVQIWMLDVLNNGDNDRHCLFGGIISKGEEQQIELIYSPFPADEVSAKKIVDIELLEKEINNAFNYKILNSSTFKKQLYDNLKQAQKNQNDGVVSSIRGLENTLQREKNRLEAIKKQKQPLRPMPKSGDTEENRNIIKAWGKLEKWERSNIRPIDYLIADTNELIKSLEGNK